MDYLLSKMSHLHQAETQARNYVFTEDGSYSISHNWSRPIGSWQVKGYRKKNRNKQHAFKKVNLINIFTPAFCGFS